MNGHSVQMVAADFVADRRIDGLSESGLIIIRVGPDGRVGWVTMDCSERDFQLPFTEMGRRYLEPAMAALKHRSTASAQGDGAGE